MKSREFSRLSMSFLKKLVVLAFLFHQSSCVGADDTNRVIRRLGSIKEAASESHSKDVQNSRRDSVMGNTRYFEAQQNISENNIHHNFEAHQNARQEILDSVIVLLDMIPDKDVNIKVHEYIINEDFEAAEELVHEYLNNYIAEMDDGENKNLLLKCKEKILNAFDNVIVHYNDENVDDESANRDADADLQCAFDMIDTIPNEIFSQKIQEYIKNNEVKAAKDLLDNFFHKHSAVAKKQKLDKEKMLDSIDIIFDYYNDEDSEDQRYEDKYSHSNLRSESDTSSNRKPKSNIESSSANELLSDSNSYSNSNVSMNIKVGMDLGLAIEQIDTIHGKGVNKEIHVPIKRLR